MAICIGKHKTRTGRCGSILYRCRKCANVGCMQSATQQCTNQGFTGTSICLKCNTSGQKEPLK